MSVPVFSHSPHNRFNRILSKNVITLIKTNFKLQKAWIPFKTEKKFKMWTWYFIYLFLFHVANLLVNHTQNLLHGLRLISISQVWKGRLDCIVANHCWRHLYKKRGKLQFLLFIINSSSVQSALRALMIREEIFFFCSFPL